MTHEIQLIIKEIQDQEKIRDSAINVVGGIASSVALFTDLFATGGFLSLLSPIVGEATKNLIRGQFIENKTPNRRTKLIASLKHALIQIDDMQKNGISFRNDGELTGIWSGRTSIEEILEDFFKFSINESEAKKLKFYSNLFTSAVFENGFSKQEFHHLIKTLDTLTYKQLVLINIAYKKSQGPYQTLLKADHSQFEATPEKLPPELLCTLQEILNLFQLGFVGERNTGGTFLSLPDAFAVTPDQLIIYGQGKRLYELCKLDQIEDADVQYVADLLS